MKGLIFFWARNKVAANFLMFALIVGGLFTWIKLKKEIFPEIIDWLDRRQLSVRGSPQH